MYHRSVPAEVLRRLYLDRLTLGLLKKHARHQSKFPPANRAIRRQLF